MAIVPNWITKTFSIPQADLTFVSGTLYELNTESGFRQLINTLMASEEGIVFDTPINHNTEVAIAGITYARLIEMINGYSIVFTPDSQWSVRLVGSNNDMFDIENGKLNQNQVQVIPSNSAGLIAAPQMVGHLEDLKYEGKVWVDPVGGSPGTTHPAGTRQQPVDSIADALIIAADAGLTFIMLLSDTVIGATDDVSNFKIEGLSTTKVQVNVTAGALTNKSMFQYLYLRNSTLSGHTEMRDCLIENVIGFRGVMRNCMLNPGTITLQAGNDAHFLHCYSGEPGVLTPIIDVNGKNLEVGFRGYNGGITMRNNTAANNISIDLNSGQIILEATCTGGAIICRGTGKLTDNSAGSTVIDELMVGAKLDELHRVEGLKSGEDLLITDTSRDAGDISQTIADDGTTTTVSRP